MGGNLRFERISYPKNVKIARDPKWIAAMDEHGVGMMQCSTCDFLGRKLFVWGDGHGGDNWKNFLSDGTNDGYAEIRGGWTFGCMENASSAEPDIAIFMLYGYAGTSGLTRESAIRIMKILEKTRSF